jgi:predicted lipoprotein with Yx(FWY)xxD motif
MRTKTLSLGIVGATLAAAGVVLLAACGSGSGYGSSGNGSSMYGTSAPTTVATAQVATDVAISTSSKLAKPLLVDEAGRTIYLFVPNGNSTTSTVPAQFRPNWPPVTAASMPSAGAGLDSSKLVEHTQPDGTRQLSYNGHLLYVYVGDQAPGDVNGQGFGNNWYVVAPSGDAIQ